ncbi:aspartate ammonia-lyase [Marinitoga sp. 1197]|uniref:aspartate ammonia-lyase n=1 Tax=unclassified Marinitoga TaxID=2640159 RepID=UPI0006412874|nr:MULTISPECIES: aspartate ammonia-lyase [unclassified Marinitoga]KLO22822.1 aspartate ammonia-lyase [Marinitoga sp. 1197]KLO24095.1 aspartate ammonia-lyase [Marinitoga sp. 1155]NUU99364.1 aspartate ammonia-lyase [Marinitoga sp. 1154]
MRVEKDFIGEVLIPENVYYGIHTHRALKNFPKTGEIFSESFIWAMFMVKKSAAILNYELGYLDKEISEAIVKSCEEWPELKKEIIVDPLSGGAGTSINMNINEVIANRATEILGGQKSEYIVNPLDHVNMHQSTNDVFPTAGKIAIIKDLRELIEKIIKLQDKIQEKEKDFIKIRKIGRTQLMDAVPILLGQEFGAWADALSRDRWRLYKVEERIRSVNIGGTAIGTGISAPKDYILKITNKLREITKIGIAKAENLIDTTQNLDVFSEISGLLKSLAVNLIKISNDIRLLGSNAINEIILPKIQAGSSIMPGKVNPVIPEYVVQLSMSVISFDNLITTASSLGNLELNHLTPLIIHYTLKSIKFLKNAVISLKNYIKLIEPDESKCKENLAKSFTLITPLIDVFGYDEVSIMLKKNDYDFEKTVRELSEKHNMDYTEIMKKLKSHKAAGLGYNF